MVGWGLEQSGTWPVRDQYLQFAGAWALEFRIRFTLF